MANDDITRNEVNKLKARLLGLPEVAKFEMFSALRNDLAAVLNNEDEKNRLIEQRREAIEAIAKVAKHLGLDARTAPTHSQFDKTAKELELEWSSAKVTRLYERWRNATEAYLGRKARETPEARALRQRRGKRKRSPDFVFEGVREWLATQPKKEGMPEYDRWVEETNAKLADGQEPYVRGQAIRAATTVGWKSVLAIAKDEIDLDEAREQEMAELLPPRTTNAIVGLAAIGRLLGLSQQHTKALADGDHHEGFPTPVAVIEGHRAWLVKDIRAYGRGANFAERTEGELQALYMDASELEARLDLNHRQLLNRIKGKRWDQIPQPEGFVSKKHPYWYRDKVEKWLVANSPS